MARPPRRTFPQPDGAATVDFAFGNARDFAPERARGDNAYEAAARHLLTAARSGRRAILAAYSTGSRARITSILAEAQSPGPTLADNWQEALGIAGTGRVAAIVLPLDTGFANADIELVTEQDLLGDRLVRRKRRRNPPTLSLPNWPP
jgi:transcription-repair coupling factor (superfamily II helicase)